LRITTKIVLVIIIGLSLISNQGFAQKFSKHDIKSAYIHNIIRFIKWPSEKTSLTLVVVGKNEFTSVLKSKLKNQKIGNRTIKIVDSTSKENYTNCDIIFFAKDERFNHLEILKQIRNYSILSIGENESFCGNGGIINFVEGNNGNYFFEINQSQAMKEKIQISSKLLNLAIKII